jgi:hypothetical protein
MWLIVEVLNRLTRLLSNFFLSGVWLVRAEGGRTGLYFTLGRTVFVSAPDSEANPLLHLSLEVRAMWYSIQRKS